MSVILIGYSNEFLELFTHMVSTSKGLLDGVNECCLVISHLFSGLEIQWICGVRFDEQENQTKDNRVDSQHWFPFSKRWRLQNIEANVSSHINIRVIDLSLAQTMRRRIWVVCRDLDIEGILSTLPMTYLFTQIDSC